MECEVSMSMEDFSPEILLNILWYLKYEDVCSFSVTNIFWRDFISDDLIWKDLTRRDYFSPGFLGFEFLESNKKLCRQPQHSERLTSTLNCRGDKKKTRELTASTSELAKSRKNEPKNWSHIYRSNHKWASVEEVVLMLLSC